MARTAFGPASSAASVKRRSTCLANQRCVGGLCASSVETRLPPESAGMIACAATSSPPWKARTSSSV